MLSRTRFSLVALALAGAPLLAGCNTAELERLQASESELQQQVRSNENSLAEMRTANAALQTELSATSAAAEQAAKDAETAYEDLDDDKHEIASHRDELVEWVNELLPLAEKQDPRLQNLRDITDDIAQQVEEYRGLKFKRPFMRRLIHRDQVKDFMRRDMEREMPPEEMDKMVRVMSEFGLLSRDADILEMFEGFMEAGAAAFYKPNTGTFYLIEGKNDRGDRPVVFHELTHALEDQYFDLTAMQTAVEKDSDASMGVKGLVEGSAERLTTLYTNDNPEDLKAMMAAQMSPDLIAKQGRMLQEVPTFLIAAMGLYPYKNGAAWLDGIGVAKNADLDVLFASPPVSTEQVLHPEKHGKDFPHSIAAPDIENALGDGWEVLDDDVMGELFVGLTLATNRYNPTLKTNMPVLMSVMDMRTQGIGFKGKIKKAVEGWDGDRYSAAVHNDGDSTCVVWTSMWDSDKDALEFAEYYVALVGARVAGDTKPLKDVTLPARFTRAADGAVSGVEVDGRKVVVVLSAPGAQADAVFAAGHAAEIKADPRDVNDG